MNHHARFLLSLLASVNLVLFLFNLLPIYPLDGGHIAGAIYERVRAGVARVRGRPRRHHEPGHAGQRDASATRISPSNTRSTPGKLAIARASS